MNDGELVVWLKVEKKVNELRIQMKLILKFLNRDLTQY